MEVPLTLSVQFPEPPLFGYTVTLCVPASSVPLHESSLVPPRFVQEETVHPAIDVPVHAREAHAHLGPRVQPEAVGLLARNAGLRLREGQTVEPHHLHGRRVRRRRRRAGWPTDNDLRCFHGRDEADGGGHARGRRGDAALLRLGSDGFLRISELAAVRVDDLEPGGGGSGRVALPRSKTDQEGRGETLYVCRVTMAAVADWRRAAGVATGPLFRPVSRADRALAKRR